MKTEIYIRGDTQKVLCLTPENQKEQDFINLWMSVKGDVIDVVVILPEEKVKEEEIARPVGDTFIFAGKRWNNINESVVAALNDYVYYDILSMETWSGKVEYTPRLIKGSNIKAVNLKNIVGYRIAD